MKITPTADPDTMQVRRNRLGMILGGDEYEVWSRIDGAWWRMIRDERIERARGRMRRRLNAAHLRESLLR